MSAPRAPRKAEAAISLRLAGASYEQIAEVLGYASAEQALKAVENVLSATATYEDKIQMRTVASLRYEKLLSAVWNKAMDAKHGEQLAAVRIARELIERHVALQGLAVPVVQIITTPSTSELEKWVAEVSRVTMPEVVEADIVMEIENQEHAS